MAKVRVGIIGVGNCAASLVQGVRYYRDAPEDEQVPGLMHVNLGGYHIRDIEFVAAFDVDKNKVGKVTEKQVRELAEMKMQDMNCTDIESAMRTVRGTARSASAWARL